MCNCQNEKLQKPSITVRSTWIASEVNIYALFKKSGSRDSQPPTEARNIFVGRAGELPFFEQNILKSTDPTYNNISILENSVVQLLIPRVTCLFLAA